MSGCNHSTSAAPPVEDDLDQLLESALEDFDKPAKARKKVAASSSACTSNNTEAELLQIFEQVGLSAGPSDPPGLKEELEKLARLAAKQTVKGGTTSGLDPEVSLKEMMQQMTADTEQLGHALSEAELSTMFQQLQMEGSGPEDLDKLIPMMEGMMQSLLSKDLLYPAIKEMNDKFPDWLADHRSGLSAEDFTRFNKQYEKTRLICKEFEEEDSSEEEKSLRFQRVMALMQVSGTVK